MSVNATILTLLSRRPLHSGATVFLCFFTTLLLAQDPVSLVCNNLLNISLAENCRTTVDADMILENPPAGVLFDIELKSGNTVLPGNVVTSAYIDQVLTVTVINRGTGNKCTGAVQVFDEMSPRLTCTDLELNCANTEYTPEKLLAQGFAGVRPGVTDNCDTDLKIGYADRWQDFSCDASPDFSGQVIRTWTAKDASGNTGICNQTIKFRRIKLADVRFPNDRLWMCSDDVAKVTRPMGAYSGAPYVVAAPGTTEYLLNATDVLCEINVIYTDAIDSICPGTYVIRRTWRVTSWCEPLEQGKNPTTYTQLIKIKDESGPELTVPASITASVVPTQCCAVADLPDVVVRDRCSGVSKASVLIVGINAHGDTLGVYSNAASTALVDFPGNNRWNPDTLLKVGNTICLPLGHHTVVYKVEDQCGNHSTASFTLHVIDDAAPIARCVDNIVIAVGSDDAADKYIADDINCRFSGVAWAKAEVFDKGSADNCGKLRFTVRRMPGVNGKYSDCIEKLNNQHSCTDRAKEMDYYRYDPSCKDTSLIMDRGDVNCATGLLAGRDSLQTEYEVAISENDSIKFYCCEVGTPQTVVMRVYQVDAKTGFCFNDKNRNRRQDADEPFIYNECMVQVEVQDKIRPRCFPPPDMTIDCEAFDDDLRPYGQAGVNDNCCLDVSKKYLDEKGLTHVADFSNFDSVCNKGTILRTWTAWDCQGQTGRCSQRITVRYNEDYFVRFPNDVSLLACDSTGLYGEPEFFGQNCEQLSFSFEDDTLKVVPDACFKIERTWKVINWCTYNTNLPCIDVPNPEPNAISSSPDNLPGPIISSAGNDIPGWTSTFVSINPGEAPTDYSTFWRENPNCYRYKQIIKVRDKEPPFIIRPVNLQDFCDLTLNDPLLWNNPAFLDTKHNLKDLCEVPGDMCVTALDDCSPRDLTIRYLLYLDLDGNGTLETVINSINPPPAGFVRYNNANTPNFAGGELRQFDNRPVPDRQKYRFGSLTTFAGRAAQSCVRWSTPENPTAYVSPQLPLGEHRLVWIVGDGCGNEIDNPVILRPVDCLKPTVVCANGLSVNTMNGIPAQATLRTSDFLLYGEDNCTPANQLTYSMRKRGTGELFPTVKDANGKDVPVTSLTWGCNELGRQYVEIWAKDKAGNINSCETFVDIQDNSGACSPLTYASVSGALRTETKAGLEDAAVNLSGTHPNLPPMNLTTSSDKQGLYKFNQNIPYATSYTLRPIKDDNPLNGVTTFDIALINKHILGLEPLITPYQLVAADVNQTGSVTSLDMVDIRRLILGINDRFPNNNSWLFIDAQYQFPTPNNPFTQPFPETRSVANLRNDRPNEDFIAVKVGDVNNTAFTNSLTKALDRSAGTLRIDVTDRAVTTGETLTVDFAAAETVEGFQFTLNTEALEVVEILPGPGMKADHFAVFPESQAMTASLNGVGVGRFSVVFRARAQGMLHDLLSLSGRITAAEGYDAAGGRLDLALRFNAPEGVAAERGVGLELYTNTPNPWLTQTWLRFHLPEGGPTTLRLTDSKGRVVWTQQNDLSAGYHAIPVSREVAGMAGIYFYGISTPQGELNGKMILVSE